QLIGIYGRAQLMVVDQRACRLQLVVVQALLVRTQVYSGIASTRQHIGKVLVLSYIENVYGLFIGSALTHAIAHQSAVFGNVIDVDRGVLILAELAGVDEADVGAMKAFTHVNRCLVLVGL